MGGRGGGNIGTCELQVREEGGEGDKGGYWGAGIGAPGACCVGEHVVGVRLKVTHLFSLLRTCSVSSK